MDPFLLGILSGVTSGLISSYLMIRFLKNITENEMESGEQDNELVINIEFQGTSMYLYNKQTSEFVLQGSNWDNLYDQLKKRFPDKVIYIENGQLERAKRFGIE